MPYTHLQILGPFNTGTNLADKLLNRRIHSPSGGSTHIWKHSILLSEVESTIQDNPETLFVVCYRPLFHWVKSMEKMSYELIWDNRIDTPVKLRGCSFPNIVELYRHYYTMYQSLILRYKNVIWIEYYRVCDKATSYNYMKSKLDPFNVSLISQSEYATRLNVKSKTGYSVKSSREAMEKKKHLDSIKPSTFPVVQEVIDFFEESNRIEINPNKREMV